ncbi:MAG: tetratricopeptide repeat protein [Burkholderiaceae bacterium]
MSYLLRRGFMALGLAHAAGWSHAAPSDDADNESLLSDTDYAAARVALKADDPAAALRRLEQVLKRFPDNADVHNELGFAHRRLKNLDQAFVHYRRALAINPQHRAAHEYIGEAFLMVGDVPAAERHLASLRSICLLPCEELRDLETAITEHRQRTAPR